MKRTFANGTWLDPEQLCYPSGAITAGRKAKALCPDGKVRTCQVGLPDTIFSIPARVKVFGKTVTGFVFVNHPYNPTLSGPLAYGGSGLPVLQFVANIEHAAVFLTPKPPTKRKRKSND
jgi:hypothetical protein